MKLLIVDDSPILRERLSFLLSDIEGVQSIEEAENFAEARQKLLKFKPEVVILDISFPEGSGICFIPEIKKLTPSPRILMLTNYATPPYKEAAIRAGADYFFDKSTEFNKLVDLIRCDALQKKQNAQKF